ncbi:hypothetical protein V8F63_01840 [Brevundimonas sp. LF-1]|uniref:hypothetical protein n=1 Tax=Brevundimonas sp. LF-1 TaxID=3126100 RepID=UPI0030E50FCA
MGRFLHPLGHLGQRQSRQGGVHRLLLGHGLRQSGQGLDPLGQDVEALAARQIAQPRLGRQLAQHLGHQPARRLDLGADVRQLRRHGGQQVAIVCFSHQNSSRSPAATGVGGGVAGGRLAPSVTTR